MEFIVYFIVTIRMFSKFGAFIFAVWSNIHEIVFNCNLFMQGMEEISGEQPQHFTICTGIFTILSRGLFIEQVISQLFFGHLGTSTELW